MSKEYKLTVLQWFEMLPPKLRDKAQAYAMDDYGVDYSGDDIDISLEDALYGGIMWRNTEEGVNYWVDVKNNAPRYQSAYIKKHRL